MADIALSNTGNDSNDGSGWATAKLTMSAAITAAGANGRIFTENTFSEVVNASRTYIFLSGQQIFSTADTTNFPPQSLAAGAKISMANAATANQQIRLNNSAADSPCLMHGFTLEIGTGNTATPSLRLSSAVFFDTCTFSRRMTSTLSHDGGHTRNCTYLNAAGVTSNITGSNGAAAIRSENDTYFPTGGVPSPVFAPFTGAIIADGCDFSTCQYIANTSSADTMLTLNNCKLHPSFAIQSPPYISYATQTISDCSSGDEHYKFTHADRYGTCQVDTGHYVTADGASYDGTNKCCWVITSTAKATKAVPYKSPWISVYHDGVAAITPYLEILRDGSATPFTDGEVWVEFAYKGTSGSTRITYADDGAAILAAGTAQDNSATAWTGAGGTAWAGKLVLPSAITPQEIGTLRARVCVAGGLTVYVDPKIRGV